MGEGEVPDVMTKGGHPDHLPPVLVVLGFIRDQVLGDWMEVLRIGDRVVDPASQMHHAEGVFEAPMGRPGIEQVR